MKKHVLFISIITIIFLAFGITYTWLTYSKDYPLVQIKSGKIGVDTAISGKTLVNEVELPSLMYVDFSNDIVNDKTNTLNDIATNLIITITGQDDTLDFKNEVSLSFPENQEDLIYLIIYEGLNIDESSITSDYHQYMENLVTSGQTDEATWRQAIETNNQTVLDTIKNVTISEFDTLTIQVVFWGDYNNLSNPSNYLNETYNVELTINAVQLEKE